MKDTLWLTDVEHFSMPLHTKRASGLGVNGGRDGRPGATWVFEPGAFDVTERKDLIGTDVETYRKSTPVAGVLDEETNAVDPNGPLSALRPRPNLAHEAEHRVPVPHQRRRRLGRSVR